MGPSVTVAFVPRETMSQTLEMLDTLLAHTEQPFVLIVVAAGYPGGLVNALRERVEAVGGRLIEFAAYVTPNEARNAALNATKTDYIVFLDQDVHVDRNWLPSLLACAKETGAAIVAPLIFELEPKFTQIHMAGGEARVVAKPGGGNIYHEVHYEAHAKVHASNAGQERRCTELVEFHAVLVEVAWLKLVGGLDPELFSLSEHWDMCIAAARSGREIYLEPKSRVNYMPPRNPTADDLRWFATRWSHEWNERSIAHMCRKYDLCPDEASFEGLRRFLRSHRDHRFIRLRRKFVRYLGQSAGLTLFNRFARPILEQLEKPRVRRDLRRWEFQRNARKLGDRLQQY